MILNAERNGDNSNRGTREIPYMRYPKGKLSHGWNKSTVPYVRISGQLNISTEYIMEIIRRIKDQYIRNKIYMYVMYSKYNEVCKELKNVKDTFIERMFIDGNYHLKYFLDVLYFSDNYLSIDMPNMGNVSYDTFLSGICRIRDTTPSIFMFRVECADYVRCTFDFLTKRPLNYAPRFNSLHTFYMRNKKKLRGRQTLKNSILSEILGKPRGTQYENLFILERAIYGEPLMFKDKKYEACTFKAEKGGY
jgi:DNA-binding Lrp family transcriptional regulator